MNLKHMQMKCLHCGGEHPADYKFCPVTGKEMYIHDGLKACLRPDCPDYGKYILPKEAKYCPRCGKEIEENSKRKENDIQLDFSKAIDTINNLFHLKKQ